VATVDPSAINLKTHNGNPVNKTVSLYGGETVTMSHNAVADNKCQHCVASHRRMRHDLEIKAEFRLGRPDLEDHTSTPTVHVIRPTSVYGSVPIVSYHIERQGNLCDECLNHTHSCNRRRRKRRSRIPLSNYGRICDTQQFCYLPSTGSLDCFNMLVRVRMEDIAPRLNVNDE
jgi:hypothetical protein